VSHFVTPNHLPRARVWEHKDYSAFSKNLESGGRTIEHILTLGMAKELCMIQRTPEGRARMGTNPNVRFSDF